MNVKRMSGEIFGFLICIAILGFIRLLLGFELMVTMVLTVIWQHVSGGWNK